MSIQWNDAHNNQPPLGKVVRVIYTDGLECDALRVGGRRYMPVGDSMYRYVDVAKWREIETTGATHAS